MTRATPLHSQIRNLLEATIRSGQWRANDRVPSEREICDQHGVSRITARRAVSDLVNDGLLYTIAGKGTFVVDRPLRQELRPLVGFDEDLRSQGIATRAVVRDFRRIEADLDLALRLGLRQYSPVLRLSRLRLLRGQPLAIQTSYLPEHFCPGLLHMDFAQRSLFRTLRDEYGLDLVEGSTVITAALANTEEADLLALQPPAAVLRTSQITLLGGGDVIESCITSFHGTLFELTSATGRVAPVGVMPAVLAVTGG